MAASEQAPAPASYVDAPALSVGGHCRTVWRDAREALVDIAGLDFLAELADGTLPTPTFVHYIQQDAAYLAGYGRAMTLLAAGARDRDQMRFWARATSDTIAEEQAMQAQLMESRQFASIAAELTGDDGAVVPSPTTLGYTSWLVATAAVDEHAVAVAAVLPCFWVYAEVGRHLVETIGEAMTEHPYRRWVETYSDPEYDAAVEEACGIFESLYEEADEPLRARMRAAFRRGCAYEHHFWDAAHRREDWSR